MLQREGELEARGVPALVERGLRKYFTGGVLAHGFGRARCPACGHDFLVAFSCRSRAVCPSSVVDVLAPGAARVSAKRVATLPARHGATLAEDASTSSYMML